MSKKTEQEKKENEEKVEKVKRPIDKGRIAKSVVIIFIILTMLLSVAGTLIYYLTNE